MRIIYESLIYYIKKKERKMSTVVERVESLTTRLNPAAYASKIGSTANLVNICFGLLLMLTFVIAPVLTFTAAYVSDKNKNTIAKVQGWVVLTMPFLSLFMLGGMFTYNISDAVNSKPTGGYTSL